MESRSIQSAKAQDVQIKVFLLFCELFLASFSGFIKNKTKMEKEVCFRVLHFVTAFPIFLQYFLHLYLIKVLITLLFWLLSL